MLTPAPGKTLLIFNKPYDVLCQFTDAASRRTLKNFIPVPHVYAAGRLDRDSEGLLLLTDDGALQAKITSPRFKIPKTYWVQVDGEITDSAVQQLSKGVLLKDGETRPAKCKKIPPPDVWPRTPPVRCRARIPTSWISLTITEGRNRQVRRMTAAVGFPTLRLIRESIGSWKLGGLSCGEYQILRSHHD